MIHDFLSKHGFLLGVSLFWFWLNAGLSKEQDEMRAYKRGTFLLSWLLFGIFITVYHIYRILTITS